MWLWIWLGVIVFCLVIEFTTMELVSIWFILGALVALIMSCLGASVLAQVITAISLSVICLASFRKLALKLLRKDDAKLNIDRTIGEVTELLTSITKSKPGTISVNGVVYNAKTADGSTIKAGKSVELVEMSGNKYIVKEVKE